MYIYRNVGFKNKWTTGFYSKYPATEGNLPVRVLKYKCQMQLKMHSDRSGSQNLEFGFFGSPMELRVYGKLNKGFFKKKLGKTFILKKNVEKLCSTFHKPFFSMGFPTLET